MAYLLRFNGSPEHVVVDSHITLLSTQNYSIKYRVNIPVLRDQILSDAGDSVFNFNTYPFLRSNGGINVRAASVSGATADFTAPSGSVPAGVDTEIEIRNDVALNKISILVDGDEKASRNASSFGIKRFGFWTSAALNFQGDLLSCEVTLEGSVIHNYDPSASNGTGQILADTAGGNGGTLVNFPNDDSQWVFYDDGQGGGDTLIPTLIPSGEVVGTPSVTNLLKLIEPNTIPTEELVNTPTVDAGAVLISPATIPTGEVVYNVSVVDLTQFVTAEDIPTQEVVGSPNLELLLVG